MSFLYAFCIMRIESGLKYLSFHYILTMFTMYIWYVLDTSDD